MESKIGIHFYSYTKQDKLVNNIHKAFLGIEGMRETIFLNVTEKSRVINCVSFS